MLQSSDNMIIISPFVFIILRLFKDEFVQQDLEKKLEEN